MAILRNPRIPELAVAWNDPVDLYCERLDAGLWAEPVNAISNLAFIAAALGGYRLWKRYAKDDQFVLLLVLLALLVGIGSFVFHIVATRWGIFADAIPIALFVTAYLALALHRFVGLSWTMSAIWIAIFLAIAALFPRLLPPGFMNNSGFYFPVLGALVVLGFVLRAKGGEGKWIGGAFLSGAALFALSLSFRIVDPAVCAQFPLGTHFLWHCLNGTLIYLMLWTAVGAKTKSA